MEEGGPAIEETEAESLVGEEEMAAVVGSHALGLGADRVG